jgi:hypothetical protein
MSGAGGVDTPSGAGVAVPDDAISCTSMVFEVADNQDQSKKISPKKRKETDAFPALTSLQGKKNKYRH